eukprot:CAMPEP_0201588802 /NCGR_PEP_ID=MMETSP0190_2-20130828/159248_1 /ASSEMBLY_ACC=CAM_ASM_000263 /TAXON_ID=37353 /ORGANISM="Rosalina sp." /LENGTH=296 /DNA_ID=CAMNT_0048041657 /DNA_START=20 /DNA_END=910 /DNA_ORIENTATION=+
MPPPKGKKGKGKGKGKNKNQNQGGGHQGRGKGKGPKGKGPKGPKGPKRKGSPQKPKSKLNEKQQFELVKSKMENNIDSMYTQYTTKHKETMKTFFGIFTKHNQLQLRELIKASMPKVNDQITDKCLKQTQKDENRDINQFIFLGDIVIGAYATELKNNDKDLLLRAFCILPYFRNLGFGSRLMVKLLKSVAQRKKLQNLFIYIEEENKKGIAFVERFGFEICENKKVENNQNDKPKNGIKEEKKQQNDCLDVGNYVKLKLDVKIYRQSVMVLVRKQIKDEEEASKHAKKNDSNKHK